MVGHFAGDDVGWLLVAALSLPLTIVTATACHIDVVSIFAIELDAKGLNVGRPIPRVYNRIDWMLVVQLQVYIRSHDIL